MAQPAGTNLGWGDMGVLLMGSNPFVEDSGESMLPTVAGQAQELSPRRLKIAEILPVSRTKELKDDAGTWEGTGVVLSSR
ncbi:hypothetical protein H9638_04515 [Arthrobacter sp. Sa2BUA2]|uniref:Uncharacterized protein n=1 Tax=Arthrobacter pullicola TaxID=2762224 RepID=A0ABR8YFS3_9MICC|nr:hypothetical protein [Arthrobacter pullicola]MBD8043071.1 hypothetical protein [Arthrobacter pullicola]